MNRGEIISSELVVAGGDAAEIFEPAEATLDDIASFVGFFVEAMEPDAVGFVGNDRLGAALADLRPEAIAVIAPVGNQGAHVGQERQNLGSRGDIGVLAWRQMKGYGPATRVARRVDFGRAPAARTADRLLAFPPFPPEALR
mgnify:CR=1 FL=1